MGEAEWVQAGASQMREMGNELCLRQLLDVLVDEARANKYGKDARRTRLPHLPRLVPQ